MIERSTRRTQRRRAQAAAPARHELPAPRLLRRVVVHGDFKAENLFFEPHVSGPNPRCAACDFQWAGLGVGACDVVYLLTTSLCDGLLAEREAELLQHYRRAVVREMGVYAPTPAEFEHEYAIALLDFARFVLADGPLVDGDEWICARADALLGRLEAPPPRRAGRRTTRCSPRRRGRLWDERGVRKKSGEVSVLEHGR